VEARVVALKRNLYLARRAVAVFGHDTVTRRRNLALGLYGARRVVARSGITDLSTRLAHDYARKTGKTLTRDLNALLAMGLIKRTAPGHFAANQELIFAFRPERVAPGK
jgi:hypothetical protein